MSPSRTAPGRDDVRELMRLAHDLAAEAAELIVRFGPAGRLVADTKSSPTDVVTATDRAAEELLRERLRVLRPGDALYGEEAGGSAGDTGLTWVLDPIDGTVNFVYGLPGYCVSIAAVTGDPHTDGGWQPLAGCVLSPGTGQLWTAGLGQGSYLDGQRLQIRPPPEPAQALVATGFSYSAQRRAAQARLMAAVLPQLRDIRRMGSAAMELCMVASGQLDAYYEQGLNTWDIAAAHLVVTEAGGTVRGLGDVPAGAHMVIAAAEPLCHQLADLLSGSGDAEA